ncbi:MAG: CPBP family glutamic-type intramembrane protease [Planctomycetota bacterium]|jgi:membrane protease YdiL (CAAX protease family)
MSGPANRHLFLPFALPYAAYVAIAAIPDAWMGREMDYLIRIVATGALVTWAWRRYLPMRGPGSPLISVSVGMVAGLIGMFAWVALVTPLAGEGDGAPWSTTAFWLRLLAATALVPLFEEQLMRGFVLRFVLQWERARKAEVEDPFGEALDKKTVLDVAPGAATAMAVAVSTLVFLLGHRTFEMPAAAVYGLWMATLWIVRRDLLTCVVAHATTNLTLALYIQATGSWGLW